MLYAHLISKTGTMHEEPIKKHIQLFHEFLEANKNAIMERKWESFTRYKIHYSEKVGVDLEPIFEVCDDEERQTILNHLLTLLAVVDPSSSAKEILDKHMEHLRSLSASRRSGEEGKDSSEQEETFLRDIMHSVSDNMDPTVDNPMALMNKMMNNGVFSNLMERMNQNLNEGNLDLGNMMNTMQRMMGNLQPPNH